MLGCLLQSDILPCLSTAMPARPRGPSVRRCRDAVAGRRSGPLSGAGYRPRSGRIRAGRPLGGLPARGAAASGAAEGAGSPLRPGAGAARKAAGGVAVGIGEHRHERMQRRQVAGDRRRRSSPRSGGCAGSPPGSPPASPPADRARAAPAAPARRAASRQVRQRSSSPVGRPSASARKVRVKSAPACAIMSSSRCTSPQSPGLFGAGKPDLGAEPARPFGLIEIGKALDRLGRRGDRRLAAHQRQQRRGQLRQVPHRHLRLVGIGIAAHPVDGREHLAG